ncbi:MAG: TonB C-terminal domain-containing protein [Terracidiphilus sp.]
MDSVLDSSEHVERELTPDPVAGPAAGAVGLHLMVAVFLVLYGWMMGVFHHNIWGSAGSGGSMEVTLVSSAIPLPADQMNQNVLATETPSQAPAQTNPKDQKHEDATAIPIQGRQAKPTAKNIPKTQPHQPAPRQNVAQYGEQAGSNMPHQMQPGSTGPTTVGDNGFANSYPWYVDQINRKMGSSWNKYDVDPRTPKGARAFIVFTIHRDGGLSNLQLDQSSGSPTLDTSCQRAAQRVDTFGYLPPQYNQSTLKVSFYCEY